MSQRPGWPGWPAALKAVPRADEQGRATLAGSAAVHWKIAGNSGEPLTTLQILVKTSSSKKGQASVRRRADWGTGGVLAGVGAKYADHGD